MAIWLAIKFIIKLQKSKKFTTGYFRDSGKWNGIYQKKDIYLQKKDRKLLMNSDWYNDIVMDYQKIINC